MKGYDVHEERLDPKSADYLQRWLDEYAKQREPVRFVADEPDEWDDDGFDFWRGVAWAVPVGLVVWGLVLWLFW